jgi:hypothetical protein
MAKAAGQSWDDALNLAAAAAAAGVLGGPRYLITSSSSARDRRCGGHVGWRLIVRTGHRPTGLRVSHSVGEVTVTVPYWTRDNTARQIVEVISVGCGRGAGNGTPRPRRPQLGTSVATLEDLDRTYDVFDAGAVLFRLRARAHRIEFPT